MPKDVHAVLFIRRANWKSSNVQQLGNRKCLEMEYYTAIKMTDMDAL